MESTQVKRSCKDMRRRFVFDPPITKRGDVCVLFALTWTVKEPKAGTLVFDVKETTSRKTKKKKHKMMNRIHQDGKN